MSIKNRLKTIERGLSANGLTWSEIKAMTDEELKAFTAPYETAETAEILKSFTDEDLELITNGKLPSFRGQQLWQRLRNSYRKPKL
jgi:hypothetical protein